MLEWEGGDPEAFLTTLDVGGSEYWASESLSLSWKCLNSSLRWKL